jgi:hypothetical protein
VVSGFGRTLLAALIALSPSTAAADWLIAGFVGAAKTPATTLTVTPDGGAPFELADVAFVGKPFKTPPYYGYRIAWNPEYGADVVGPRLGFEAEFIHAKTIAVDTKSAALTAFQQSHGLNFILGNVTVRSRAFCNGRCIGVGRVGAGITLPHVEATFLAAHRESYQYGGPAMQAGAGLEITIHGGLTAIADGRYTYTRVADDLPGAVLKASFSSWHASVGAGWRFR